MKKYLNNLQKIDKSVFISRFEKHATDDKHENNLLHFHKTKNDLNYYLGLLNVIGIDNLVLPHHSVELEPGRDPDRPVKTGGDYFKRVITNYVEDYIPNKKFKDCYCKALSQGYKFFHTNDVELEADFLFVTNDKNIAHVTDDYSSNYPSNSIFIGNGFHRMISYGLFIEKYGFRTIEVHYVENPTIQ